MAAAGVSLALGVVAKETIVLMVPAYWACWWRKGWPAFWKAAALGAVCVAAFLAVRIPNGWSLNNRQINGLDWLMLWDNLGIGPRHFELFAPLWVYYLHPAMFILTFVPFIAMGWGRLDGRLKALCLTLPALVLLSNLMFGWIYESRNYMPLVPLLATSAMLAFSKTGQSGKTVATKRI